MDSVEQKHLKGLTYKTSKPTKGEDGKTKYIPVERALKVDDLLDQRDNGATFAIVTKDGRKYNIPKEVGKAGDGSESGSATGDAGK